MRRKIARLAMLAPRLKALDPRIAHPPLKRVDPFYQSAEWTKLIAAIIAQRGRRCEDRDHDPRRPREGIRIFGDHIVEMKDRGAPLDPRNILLRCSSCHQLKTNRERAQRHRTVYR
jgi:hypothetical protein